MARTARSVVGGVCYHVINRGNRRATVFHTPADYDGFTALMARASERMPMRILAYCLMPNHFHFVLWPRGDQDTSRWMHWLMTTHVVRYHKAHGTSGRIWQGRFKAFPIQADRHLLTVMRYVERNPVRAGLVDSAADWKWSSLSEFLGRSSRRLLSAGPVTKPRRWQDIVDQPQSENQLAAVRRCASKNAPFGSAHWTARTAADFGLESSLRGAGRPKRGHS